MGSQRSSTKPAASRFSKGTIVDAGAFIKIASRSFFDPAGTYPLSLAYAPDVQESVMSDPLRVLIVDDDSSIQQIVEEILCDGTFPAAECFNR